MLCVHICKFLQEIKPILNFKWMHSHIFLFYFTLLLFFCSIPLYLKGKCWHHWIVAYSLEDIVQEELVNIDVLGASVVGDLIL